MVGSRILLRAQTDAKQNGIYTVTALGSGSAPWVVTRATDADNNPAGELATGDFVFVTSGTANGSKGFIMSTTGTIAIGTTEITYAQFNASEAVIAGAGITKTGETISITTGGVTSAMIADATIMDADINASAAIAQSKILNLTSDLNAKAPTANPTFTGTVAGVTKDHVGLGNVDNTADTAKPVSTATQTALNAKLNLSGGTLTGALTLSGAPTQASHAATKAYVDNVTAGLNFHPPVRVATTFNMMLAGTPGIDGVTVAPGDRVLVKDQTNQTQNGIYVVDSGQWVRAVDANNDPVNKISGGDFVFVLQGTVNAGFGYVCTNSGTVTIGTTNITYSPFNAGQTVVAGSGLTETTPGTFAVDSSAVQFRVTNVSDAEIGHLDGVTSAIQTQINGKANTIHGHAISDVTNLQVSLNDKSNIGHNHAISDVTNLQTSLNGKSNTGHTHAISEVTNLQTLLDAKANLNSPTFAGTVSGITRAMVGLGNVDNTSDANKPVSTATQNALNLKADTSAVSSKADLLNGNCLLYTSPSPRDRG